MKPPSDPSHPDSPPRPKHFPYSSTLHEMREHYRRGPRPPWWPTNEEWPPQRWRHMRGRPFFRRMGCFFFGFGFLALMGLIGLLRFILAPFVQESPRLGETDLYPLGALGFVLLVFTVGWGARSLRRVFTPLDDLFHASERVANGDYSVRVEAKGPPEVYSLMKSFNAMAERLHVHDQQRRNMLADVSHELRTPITVIQGNVEGILDGLYPADEAHLKSIIEETQILSRLVEDLRTLALAEGGALRLKREPTHLAELIRDALSGLESLAKEKEIKVNVSLEAGGEANVDPQRTREVLMNLLSNALRYTPRGGKVNVCLTETGAGAESEALTGAAVSKRSATISVEDNGPGIASADLAHVFERFYKSSDSGGMGLGLSIAKYLVEAQGGKIWAESEVGQGTKISFLLPW